jgi:hypothetical protein
MTNNASLAGSSANGATANAVNRADGGNHQADAANTAVPGNAADIMAGELLPLPGEFWIVALVILLTGVTGGLVQYLTTELPPSEDGAGPQGEAPPQPPRSLSHMLLLGVVAAACTPLFLSIVQTRLLEDIFRGGAQRYQSLLIFAGFCLVAALSARRFLDGLTNNLLTRVQNAEVSANQARRSAEQAAADVQEIAEEVNPEAADNPAAPPPPEADAAVPALDQPLVSLLPEERRALNAMTTRTYRTRTGIAEDAGIARSRISELLEGLFSRGLVAPARSPNTGGARWVITERGRQALRTEA